MHIIVVSNRLSKARSIEFSRRHIVVGAFAFLIAVVGLSTTMAYFAVRHAAVLQLPVLQSLVRVTQEADARRAQQHVRENLNAMAARLGELQAQVTRLDLLGERVSAMAGVRREDLRGAETVGRGGPYLPGAPAGDLTLEDFTAQLDLVARQLELRGDHLGVLESQLSESKVRAKLLPTLPPINVAFNASGFGWRIDPITGRTALHEGIDFIAESGTPIHAAAGGVVAFAGYHPQYGYMVELDHGNDYTTRYAHASKLLVRAGDVVQSGQKIARVGNTGRSTGSHLHFEVRYKGDAKNPARYLQVAAK